MSGVIAPARITFTRSPRRTAGSSARRTAASRFEIKAELADVLFTPGAPRSRKIFERDAKGSVTGFLSRREERDVVFEREQ